MTRLYIGGVRGVGKTSVCLDLKKKYPTILYVSDSQLMMTSLGLKTRDELWETSDEVKLEARRRAHCVYTSSKDVVVDGHFVLFPDDVQNFDKFAWIDASNELISRYRIEDHSRTRQTDIEGIEAERTILMKQLEAIGLDSNSDSITRIVNDGTKTQLFAKIESLWLKNKEK